MITSTNKEVIRKKFFGKYTYSYYSGNFCYNFYSIGSSEDLFNCNAEVGVSIELNNQLSEELGFTIFIPQFKLGTYQIFIDSEDTTAITHIINHKICKTVIENSSIDNGDEASLLLSLSKSKYDHNFNDYYFSAIYSCNIETIKLIKSYMMLPLQLNNRYIMVDGKKIKDINCFYLVISKHPDYDVLDIMFNDYATCLGLDKIIHMLVFASVSYFYDDGLKYLLTNNYSLNKLDSDIESTLSMLKKLKGISEFNRYIEIFRKLNYNFRAI